MQDVNSTAASTKMVKSRLKMNPRPEICKNREVIDLDLEFESPIGDDYEVNDDE